MGGGTAVLLFSSLVIGAIVSGALGGLFAWLGGGGNFVLAFVVGAVVTLPISTVLGWAILVDRSTLAGAVDRPQDSIEAAWYEKAASGAFGDVLLVAALGAAAFGFTQIAASASAILLAVAVLAALDFGARYLWLKRSAG